MIRDLRFYARSVAGDVVRELRFALSPAERRRFRAGLAEAGASTAGLFAFADRELGLYQRERELAALVELLNSRQPRTACEIGSWRGGTNFLLGQLVPSLELLIGVDRLPQNRLRLRCATRPGLRRRLVRGDSRSPRTRREVGRLLGERALDVLFVDGDHRYASASRDLLDYRSLVTDGGLIVFHDIVPDYRTRFGQRGGPWSGGVPALWEELRERHPHREIVEAWDQNAYGIGVIELPAGGAGDAGRSPSAPR